MNKLILVTGAGGFVGRNLCNKFSSMQINVIGIDNLSNTDVNHSDLDFELIIGDLSKDSTYKKLEKFQINTIIHCAAQSSNELSYHDPVLDLASNQIATLKLLDYAKVNDIKRFIFTSSMSVYGEQDSYPTSEDHRYNPLSYYAIHKVAAEQYVMLFNKFYDLDTTIFRLYTTYGHGQNLLNRDQGLLSIYLSYIVKNEAIIVKGSLDRVRDIIHVDDVVNAILFSMDNKNTYGEVYNLGSGEILTIREIITKLYEHYNKSTKLSLIEEEGTTGDPHTTHANIQKISSAIGWEPSVKPLEGIRKTVEMQLKK